MSTSFEQTIAAMTETLRTHVLPKLDDDFVRGQVFGIMFCLNGLKLSADWAVGPLARQVGMQDGAIAQIAPLIAGHDHPRLPAAPRIGAALLESTALEAMRDDGDRKLGAVLLWATAAQSGLADDVAAQVHRILRDQMRAQLKVEIAMTAKSMFHEIATGRDDR